MIGGRCIAGALNKRERLILPEVLFERSSRHYSASERVAEGKSVSGREARVYVRRHPQGN